MVVFFLCVLRVGAQEKVKYHAHPAEKDRAAQQEEEDPPKCRCPPLAYAGCKTVRRRVTKAIILPWENVLSIVYGQLLEWLLCRLPAVVLCSSYHGSDMIARADPAWSVPRTALGGLIFVLLWRNMTPQNTRHDATVQGELCLTLGICGLRQAQHEHFSGSVYAGCLRLQKHSSAGRVYGAHGPGWRHLTPHSWRRSPACLRKPVAITHGIGLLLVLLGALACWLALVSTGPGLVGCLSSSYLDGLWRLERCLVARSTTLAQPLWWGTIILAGLAAYLAIHKPF